MLWRHPGGQSEHTGTIPFARRWPAGPLLAGTTLLLAGAWLARTDDLNQALFLLLNQSFAALPAGWWAGWTNLGSAALVTGLVAACAVWSLRPLVLALLASLPTALLVQGLKRLIAEPRPAAVLPQDGFVIIDHLLRSGAFPSGHTATGVVLACAIASLSHPRWRRWRWPLALFFALAVGLSRIAVGAHWPSDVLAGLGAGLVGVALAHHWVAAAEQYLQRQPLVQTTLVGIAAAIGTTAGWWDRGLYPSGAWMSTFAALATIAGAAAFYRHRWIPRR